MATHFKDRNHADGQLTACKRYFTNAVVPLPRGVAITTNVRDVSCQRCLGSERFKSAKARISRPLDSPTPGFGKPGANVDN